MKKIVTVVLRKLKKKEKKKEEKRMGGWGSFVWVVFHEGFYFGTPLLLLPLTPKSSVIDRSGLGP